MFSHYYRRVAIKKLNKPVTGLKIFCAAAAIFLMADSASAANGTPHGRPQVENIPALREQMDKMILSVTDMDIMVNRDRKLNYEILKEDAQRILNAAQAIRTIDKKGLFKKNLKELEAPTQKMLKFAGQNDARASQYPEQIFNACFRCHLENRGDLLSD